MANEFYIAEDIKVEMYLPADTVAVWNFSNWDDGSLWGNGTTDSSWVDVVATVANAEVVLGATVEGNYYAPARPNTLTITMQSEIYDPFSNPFIRPGLPIRLRYRANPDTAPTTYSTLFQGEIDTFEVYYDSASQGDLSNITITASSTMRKYVNKTIDIWNNSLALSRTTEDLFNYWGSVVEPNALISGTWIPFQASYVMATEYLLDQNAADILNQLTETSAGIVWQNPETNNIEGYDQTQIRTLLSTAPTNIFSNAHTTAATHFCIAEINFAYDIEEAYNYFYVECTLAPSTNGKKLNQDLIDIYGEKRLSKTLNFDSTISSNITTWLNNISVRNPGKRVASITTPIIRRDKKLANVAALMPMQKVGIEVDRTAYTVDETQVITSATHTITPDGWFATLEVWKGL